MMSLAVMALVARVALAATPAPGNVSPDAQDLVTRMQGFYEKTQDFTARFTQVYKYKAFKRVQESSGDVAFMKPGFMRWEYTKPTAKTFVLAKEKLYALDREAMTLTKAAMASHQLSASVTFLWGKGRLADEFSIRKTECAGCQGTLLELTPLKPDSRFVRIVLEVDPKTAQVVKSTVVDPDGSENTLTFLELKRNVGLKQERFEIETPPGTKIVDMTQPTK
jgi:outer membrane lipoprotein carrier protein